MPVYRTGWGGETPGTSWSISMVAAALWPEASVAVTVTRLAPGCKRTCPLRHTTDEGSPRDVRTAAPLYPRSLTTWTRAMPPTLDAVPKTVIAGTLVLKMGPLDG